MGVLSMNTTQAIDQLRQALRRQHMARSTEESYVFWIRRYAKTLATPAPNLPTEKKIENFLTELARSGVSASSQNQAFNAILYFYRVVLEQPIGRVDFAGQAARPGAACPHDCRDPGAPPNHPQ